MNAVQRKDKPVEIEIKEEWCKGCAICVEFCPQHVLVMKDGVVRVRDADACTGCQLCEIRCPDFAIKVSEKDKSQ